MNAKTIYETLAALGTGAIIAGCGASQAPANSAEDAVKESPVVKIESTAETPTSTAAEAKETNQAEESPAVADPKPTKMMAAAPAVAQPAAASPTPAATATPVKKATTTKTASKKKGEAAACGEGGCG